MFVKAVKKDKCWTLYPCTHIQVTNLDISESGSIDTIQIEVVGIPKSSSLLSLQSNVVTIPSDAEVVYVMNEKGATVDTYSLEIANRPKKYSDLEGVPV